MDSKPNEINLSSNRKCAEVSFIKSPHNFWLRFEEYKNDYAEMLANLQADYQNAHEDPELYVKDLSLGSIYCSFNQKLFEWHRCEVLFINKNEVFVSYIDIGSTDLIPVKSIKILKKNYHNLNRFAIQCRLNQIKPLEGAVWSSQSISIFSSLVIDKIVTLTIRSKHENYYKVDLFIKTQNIAEQLIKENAGIADKDEEKPAVALPQAPSLNMSKSNFKINSTIEYDITVTSILSPFCFYVQLNEYLDEFIQFEQTLQQFYENALKQSDIVLLTKPQIGQVCIAKYTEDQQWYRALIKEVDFDLQNVRVFFIDYGNEDTVPIDHSLLIINEQFKQYPQMAVKCCLNSIKPLTDGLNSGILSQSVDFMYDSMNGRVLALFLGKKIDDCYLVKIKTEQNADLAKDLISRKFVLPNLEASPENRTKINNKFVNKLVKEQVNLNLKSHSEAKPTQIETSKLKEFIKSEPELEINKTYEFLISYVETVSEFYVKLSDSDEAKHLASQMQYFYEKKANLPQPLFRAENACVYYDYDRKEWYRAQILHIYDAHHCLIRLVDFGTTKYVNRAMLREIYDKFLSPGCLVALACLDGLTDQNDEDIDEQIQYKFKEIALNKRLLGKVVKAVDSNGSGDNQQTRKKYVLNLFDESDESIYSVLVHNLNNSVNLAVSDKFKPVVRSKLEESQISILELSKTQLNDTAPLEQVKKDILQDKTSPFPVHIENIKKSKEPKPLFNYYDSLDFNLDLTKPYNIQISHYESATNFFCQLNDQFMEFDASYEQFQQSCSQSAQIKLQDLIQIKNLDKLAIAAKFYEDGIWYRARICNHMTTTDSTQIQVEFIDYGNCQMTSIKDCVYLSSDFSKYPRCAHRAFGLAYLESISNLENFLFYSQMEKPEEEMEKVIWQNVYFKSRQNKILVEIEQAINLLFPIGYLDPEVYNENILKQINATQISEKTPILDAKLTSIENGLKYIYFNLNSSIEELNSLEKMLDQESPPRILEIKSLKQNQFYLIKYKTKLVRTKLINYSSLKGIFQFLLIDYGTRVNVPEQELEVYRLMPKYFKQGQFALHCRLTLADNIEKVWTKEEKAKFFKQIQPGFNFRIKFLTYSRQPYIIEFYDEQKSIDFQFNQIIARLGQTDSESQPILNGCESESMRGEFYLAGGYLLSESGKQSKLFVSQNESLSEKEQFRFYLQSSGLMEQIKEYTVGFDQFANEQKGVKIKSLKKGDLFLARTRSADFLNKIRDQGVKSLISKNWSRVRVSNVAIDKQTSNKMLTIFYIDFALEFTFFYTETSGSDCQVYSFTDHKLIPMPSHFKILPVNLYECRLNRLDLARKLSLACKQNDFIDSIYLNDSFDSMHQILCSHRLQVDFSQSFLSPETNTYFYTVDLIEKSSNSNLIDLIISYSFKNIENYLFPCIISHINSVDDFYIQKEDPNNQDLLNKLQETIQEKVTGNKLPKLRSVETNKLCVSFYEEDSQFYRAKIIGFENDSLKNINNFKEDLKLDVFYLDYGNTSKVKFNQILEITPDLIDRLPRAFAINCKLDFTNALSKYDIEEFNSFFFEIFETKKFLAKFKARKAENKYHDSGFYEVQLYDSENKKSLIELLEIHLKETIKQEASCMQATHLDQTDSIEDDNAIAESFNNTSRMDDTVQVQDSFQVTSSNLAQNKLSNTWEETALELKNYNHYEDSLPKISLDKEDSDNTPVDDLYSTANSDSRFDANTTLTEEEEYITIKNCIISFMHSSEDIFVQEENFDQEIAKIQPEIDQCLDGYDLAKSKYCIAQYREDELFYRCKMLEWLEEKGEAFVEFMDYGNREFVLIDTITKMSETLLKVKPLAFNGAMGFNLEFNSKEYKKLEELVNLESKFDVRMKKSDLEGFYERQDKAFAIELSLSSNGIRITKENLLDDKIWTEEEDLDSYYKLKVKQEPESLVLETSCQVEANKNKNEDKKEPDDSEPNFGSNSNFKTSTKVNMAAQVEQTNQESSKTNSNGRQDDTYLDEDSDEVIEDKHNISIVNKEEKKNNVFYVENNSSSELNGTVLNHNNTVDKFADQSSVWTVNESVNEENNHKNLTVTRFADEDSRWTINEQNDQEENKNLTVSRFQDQDSIWSINNKSKLENTVAEDGLKDLTHFPDQNSVWSVNNSKLEESQNQNETVSRWSINNDKTLTDETLNESGVPYACKTINENNQSVWVEDPDQSGFDIRKNSNTVKSNLDTTRTEEPVPEYTRVLVGNVIHVNSLDNFYFQAEDADVQLMKMKQIVDKCELKKFDKAPTVGQMCITKYRVDEQMYRAQIVEIIGQNLNTSISDPRVKVLYIDYGNEDYVNMSEIFKMSNELKYISPLAMQCSLAFTRKFENLVKTLNEQKKDSSELIKYFLALTSKSKTTIKVRKQNHLNSASNLVDLFIRNQNICDLLVAEALACLTKQSEQFINKIKIQPNHKEFDCYVLNLTKHFSLEIKLRNETVLNLVEDLIMNFNDQTLVEIDPDDLYCLAPLNNYLIEKYKLNNSYARAFIFEKKNDQARVKYLDLDYETWVNRKDLVRTNSFLSQIQPGVDTYQLDLKNFDLISKLSTEQLENLALIFRLALNYEPESSCKLKARLVKKSIRLIDTERDNLDLNTLLELTISLMANPWYGKVCHLENDFTQFDFVNDLANNPVYSGELKKLFISSGLFDYPDLESQMFSIGQVCLVDHTTAKRVHTSDSILSLAEHVIEEQEEEKSSYKMNYDKELFRALVLDQTPDKCVVLNLDSGRQLTITKRRLRVLNSSTCSRLIEKLPFMTLKCKADGQTGLKSIQRILHKSRFYGDSIKLNVLNSWKEETCLNKDLCKIVKIISNEAAEEAIEQTQLVNKKRDNFYRLVYAKSLTCFFLHTSDSPKQLKFIEDQIEFEANNKSFLIGYKNPPKINHIYAVYSRKEKKYFRIRLLNHYVSTQADNELYQGFYIDYGYVDRVHLNDLIQLSEGIQLIAPQAICCKLNGFQPTRNEFEDAESGNESECIDEDYLSAVFELFKQILKPDLEFAATIYKQYSISKKIVNFLPLQSDNSKPIEIVIHLFDSNENLSDLLKKKCKPSTQIKSKGLKKLNLILSYDYEVDFAGIVSPNEFYLSLKNSHDLLKDLSEKLCRESKLKPLKETNIHKGLICAYIKKEDSIYKRALITELTYIKNQISIRLFLIDFGAYTYAPLECLYTLPDNYYELEALCFKASLDMPFKDKHTEYSVTQKFKSLIGVCKEFHIQVDRIEVGQFDMNKYHVQINALKPTPDPKRNTHVNIRTELDAFLRVVLSEKLIWEYVDKTTVYNETKLPLKQVVKVQLTNVDTAKHFGLVLSVQNEKRMQFLSKFNQWHKDNKKNLKLLVNSNQEVNVTRFIGSPCAICSVQIGKWCRGLIVQCDLSSSLSYVYLVDFCKTLTVPHDRLYRLDNEEFLNEPTYAHRCQLQDDQNQLEQFAKYIDLLKSNANTNSLTTPNESLNSSHISIENFEINIECIGQELVPLQPVNSSLKNYQYTVKVIEIKRIRSPFPQSPHSILNNTAKIKLSHQQVKYESSFSDETTENILCSTYKENFHTDSAPRTLTITQTTTTTTLATNDPMYENDYQNDTFSAITESTRIQTFHDETNLKGDSTLCESTNYTKQRRRSLDKREQTSNWIKDLEENEENQYSVIKNDLEPGCTGIRVRVVPVGFSPNGFICQKLDLLNSYERLQAAMNDYYQKITNASKSLERDKSDPRYNSLRSEFTDSLDEDKSLDNDLFSHSFHPGDYCAAYLGKSWARCLILDVNSKVAHVECVDDGRTHHIPFSKLEKLSDNFKLMPRFSFKCRFANLDSKILLGFDLKEIENFYKYLVECQRELTADVLDCIEDNGQVIYEINLFINKKNVISTWEKH